MVANHIKVVASYNKMIANFTKYHFCDIIDPADRDAFPNCKGK